MANLVLTQSCSKNCAYCFARDFRLDKTAGSTEMSLETVARVLDKVEADRIVGQGNNPPRVSLLGGEPTMHSQFSEILDLCVQRKIDITLVSNFLFDASVRDKLIALINQKVRISFLVNSTELRNEKRLQTFSENYNAIYSATQAIAPTEQRVTCGFTLDGELLSLAGFSSYIDFLAVHLKEITAARISLNFPGAPEGKEKYYFLNNKDLGDLVYNIAKKLLSMGINPNTDCITYPCMYRSDNIFAFLNRHVVNSSNYICREPPEDFLPDGTARFCFPTLPIQVDGKKYRSESGIRDALKAKYEKIRKEITLPRECQQCSYLKNKQCVGPCLGFADLSKY